MKIWGSIATGTRESSQCWMRLLIGIFFGCIIQGSDSFEVCLLSINVRLQLAMRRLNWSIDINWINIYPNPNPPKAWWIKFRAVDKQIRVIKSDIWDVCVSDSYVFSWREKVDQMLFRKLVHLFHGRGWLGRGKWIETLIRLVDLF